LKADFARLNHVLIPATKSERDRYRAGRLAQRLQGLAWMASRTTREGRALLAVSFVAAAFTVDVARTASHELAIAGVALVVASLVFTRFYRLDAVRVELSAPRRVTRGDEITFTVGIVNEGESEKLCIRVERPLLPWDGTWTLAPPRVARLEPGTRAVALSRARFVERGEHHIDRFRVAALLPMGLAQGEPLRTAGVRFVVVPRVANVTTLPALAQRDLIGAENARATRSGDAQDLRGVRGYLPGDSVRKLHARSWARHGQPMVREYQQDARARAGVVVDDDARAATDAHFEAALSLAAGIIARSLHGEAHVESLFVGRAAHRLSAEPGSASLDQALDLLAAAQREEGFAAHRVLARLEPELDSLSVLFVVLLAWDAARAELVSTMRSRGATCVAIVVGDGAPAGHDATSVAIEAITGGKALAL
jgi:uncharacterized protein (DUF58 family)